MTRASIASGANCNRDGIPYTIFIPARAAEAWSYRYWICGGIGIVSKSIRIERSAAETIKKDLAKKGIYHLSVYGDFDRICGGIRRDCGV